MTQQNTQTVAHVLGEMTWMMSQSPEYKKYTLADLEWLVMPAILLKQFQIFYKEDKAVGFAVWLSASDELHAKLLADQDNSVLKLVDLKSWKSGPHIWLLSLVSPYDTEENQLIEKLREHIAQGLLKGKAFHYFVTDKKTGKRSAKEMQPADAPAKSAKAN